jgi:hypothetical protein
MNSYEKLPRFPTEVEANCYHTDCSLALFNAITEAGTWDVEDLCIIEERMEDAHIAFCDYHEEQQYYGD